MENNISKAYSEVDEILKNIEQKYIQKIPKEVINIFQKEKDKNYSPKIDSEIPLKEQGLQRKTLAILAMLNLNYWCETKEEKQRLLALYAENDKKRENELREKYNPDNLFKREQEEKSNIEMIEYKEQNFFKKILEKIIKFFKRKS